MSSNHVIILMTNGQMTFEFSFVKIKLVKMLSDTNFAHNTWVLIGENLA